MQIYFFVVFFLCWCLLFSVRSVLLLVREINSCKYQEEELKQQFVEVDIQTTKTDNDATNQGQYNSAGTRKGLAMPRIHHEKSYFRHLQPIADPIVVEFYKHAYILELQYFGLTSKVEKFGRR
eukprot:TRINITY_DN12659_c0_g1_i4.p4 TRINITY_DN12659_c0_g1~~TRINITY_DN12659_c0_g1_i4.p4  ORF type:complete len:123 (-),score=0.64 TRINITY_DN12659_c0_g1_i4:2531-2899(-)